MERYAAYRVPFCQNFMFDKILDVGSGEREANFSGGSGEVSTTAGITEMSLRTIESTAWEILTENCRIAAIVVGAVGGALIILGLIFNILLIASACATKPKPLSNQNDTAAVNRRKAFKSSIFVSRIFLFSPLLNLFSLYTTTLLRELCRKWEPGWNKALKSVVKFKTILLRLSKPSLIVIFENNIQILFLWHTVGGEAKAKFRSQGTWSPRRNQREACEELYGVGSKGSLSSSSFTFKLNLVVKKNKNFS